MTSTAGARGLTLPAASSPAIVGAQAGLELAREPASSLHVDLMAAMLAAAFVKFANPGRILA